MAETVEPHGHREGGAHRRRRAPGRRASSRSLLAAVVLGCLVTVGSSAPVRRQPPSRPVKAAALRPGVHGIASRAAAPRPEGTSAWRLTRPALGRQIEGYATTSSGLPGATVALRVSTSERSYQVSAYRLGAYRHGTGRLVWQSGPLPGLKQPGPSFSDPEQRTVVARWHTTAVVATSGWVPGLYVFKLTTSSGWQAHIPYVVSSPSTRSRVVVVVPVTTWQAYNDWGGYSLYRAPPGDRPSSTVSFDRPYPPPGADEMEFGALPVVVEAERTGVPVAYLTNLDLDRRPDALQGARAYVSTGHDEYWTPTMRRRVETARDQGVTLLFLGANTLYWRIRLADAGGRADRLVTGYRTDPTLDPVHGSRRTGMWRSVPPAQPENEVTGLRYQCFPVDAPFRVATPHWWGFAGTGVVRGTSFPHLVGVEADTVDPGPDTPRPLEVVADVSYSSGGVPTSAQAVYYTAASGAGVLDVGTLQWTCALDGGCRKARSPRTVRFVRRVTDTVLRAFAAGPAGRRHPAHDNVARFDLPTTGTAPTG